MLYSLTVSETISIWQLPPSLDFMFPNRENSILVKLYEAGRTWSVASGDARALKFQEINPRLVGKDHVRLARARRENLITPKVDVLRLCDRNPDGILLLVECSQCTTFITCLTLVTSEKEKRDEETRSTARWKENRRAGGDGPWKNGVDFFFFFFFVWGM